MKIKTLTLAIAAATASTSAIAQTNTNNINLLETIYVSESVLTTDDIKASYSTDTYTSEDIESSGTTNISDFLNTQTAINVQPSYGNPLAPKLDMNGYGSEAGFENIKIIVDGITINTIDLAPAQLSSISLSSIESITIVKQRGSVLYGNNASAGVIIIETKKAATQQDSLYVSAMRGSNNLKQRSMSANKTVDLDDVSIAAAIHHDYLSNGGSKQINSDGTRNSIDNEKNTVNLSLMHDHFDIALKHVNSHSNVNYPGSVTLADFKNNPDADQASGNGGITYNTEDTGLKLRSQLPQNSEVTLLLNEHKKDAYYTSGWGSDYAENTQQLTFKTRINNAVLNYGFHHVNSDRIGSTNTTSRDTFAKFFDMTTDLGHVTATTGIRQETFDYAYSSNSGTSLNKSEEQQAFNVGLNYPISNEKAVYLNFNTSYLAPNVDRFFNYGGTFNGFIETQKAKTSTLGFKHKNNAYSLTAEAFYIDLRNEIYYNSLTGQNTNIDESHKYGINMKAQKAFGSLNTHVNYNFVKAVIDEEGVISGKELPGVSNHTVTLSANYGFTSPIIAALPNHNIQLSHKHSSRAYAQSDFDNSEEKFDGYQTTNIAYLVGNKHLTIHAGVNNLFDKHNGSYLEADTNYDGTPDTLVVYPTTYERTFFLKASYQF